jgi:hypothetical protein
MFTISVFSTASRPALGATQTALRWVPGIISVGVRRPGREADHSPSSCAKVKNARSYTLPLSYVFMT